MSDRRTWIATLATACAAMGFVWAAERRVGPPDQRAFAPPRDPVTFNRHIAPILFAECSPCHRPGEIGPFSLLTYADARSRATQIVDVTTRRVMPPWKPDEGAADFLDARVLTDAQIQLIREWKEQGAIEGNPADLPAAPQWPDGWRFGAPDVIVSLEQAYQLPAGGEDAFRTFVLPIPTTAPRYVRAIEFRPGNARVVHHANLGVDRTGSSRRLDAAEPEPGYVGGMAVDARYPEGQLLGWTPGRAPRPSPEGMPWRLDPGSDLVVQLHMLPTGKPESVQPRVGFFFTDEPPTRAPVGLRLGRETIDIPAGDADYVITDDYTFPVDVELFALQPHAHYLAHRMRADVRTPDGRTRELITIRDWDFRWQDVYRFKAPLSLPRGSVISMRFEYDNSSANRRNPNQPPGRVTWGQNTNNEMGDLWVQAAARNASETRVLAASIQRKGRAEDLAAYTKLLREDPENPARHDAVGSLALEDGRVDEAVAHFTRSLALQPGVAAAHYNLGLALAARRQREDAVREFLEALRLDPAHADAHNNLGAMFHTLGRLDEALSHYARAAELRPDNVEALTNMALLFAQQGQSREAVVGFRRALTLRPDWPSALTGLAWIFATASDAAQRNSAEAVILAERAAEITLRNDAWALDTLAAAYAAAGRFDRAVETAKSALQVAGQAQASEQAALIRSRLALYQSGKAYRQQ